MSLIVSALKCHPKSTLLFLSPPFVGLATDIAADFWCSLSYRLDPWLGIQHTLLWVVAATALCQLNREFCREVVGDDPPFGTELFGMLFMSLNINAVVYLALLLPYKGIAMFLSHSC